LNLELRHHQYEEIIFIDSIFMLILQIYIHFCEWAKFFEEKLRNIAHNYGKRSGLPALSKESVLLNNV